MVIIIINTECELNAYLCRPNFVKIHGVRYTENAVVRIKDHGTVTISAEHPQFTYCIIHDIYVIEDNKVFKVRQLKVADNTPHLRSTCLELSETILLLTYNDFYSHGVLHLKTGGDQLYIIEKDTCIS